MRMAVHEVAHFFPTAIVSGRCLDKVIKFYVYFYPEIASYFYN